MYVYAVVLYKSLMFAKELMHGKSALGSNRKSEVSRIIYPPFLCRGWRNVEIKARK